MRAATLVQEIHYDVDEHWRLFLDDDFGRTLNIEGMGFRAFEPLARQETDTHLVRTYRVTPRLDALLVKFLPDFAYTEEGTFDKQTRTWSSRTIPSLYANRLTMATVVRAEPDGARRCRRTIDLSVEVRAPSVARLVENALLRGLREGWDRAARFMNASARG